MSFSYAPLDFIMVLALAIVGASFVALLAVKIASPTVAPKGVTTLLVVVLFIGGIQLLCLSIIGSYLAHMYAEVKGRPSYVVDEVLNAPSLPETRGDELVEAAARTAGSRRGPAP